MRVFILAIALLAAGAWFETARADQQFIVFFHEGEPDRLEPKQWSVGPEGSAVVREAAAFYRRYGGYILVIGNDQDVGTARDALVRSRLRAESVRDLLVSLGVPTASITTKACGISNPLVVRSKGVSEPQNRYVVLDFLDEKSDIIKAAGLVCPSAARDAAH
jgi:OmpA family